MRRVRNSEIQCFKECRQKWWWAYHQKLKSNKPAKALWFGTLVHKALELYYPKGVKRGVDPSLTFADEYGKHLSAGGEDPKISDRGIHTYLDMGVAMLEGYVEEYGKDLLFEVVQPETNFETKVAAGAWPEFVAVGQIDAVVRNNKNGSLGFLEHKTGASLEPFGAPEGLDEQSGYYWTFAPSWLRKQKVLGKKENPEFLVFNRLRKSMPDTRPVNKQGQALNKDGTVSKVQPNPLFGRTFVYRSENDRKIILARTKQVVREITMTEEGTLKPYKAPGRQCGYCEFRDMCEVHETGSDWQAIRDTAFIKWDPYEEYKK